MVQCGLHDNRALVGAFEQGVDRGRGGGFPSSTNSSVHTSSGSPVVVRMVRPGVHTIPSASFCIEPW